MSLESSGSGGVGTIELTETKKKKTPGDGDRYAHYVRKDRVTESLVTGRPVVALCGKVWVPRGSADGVPVCPKCKKIAQDMVGGNYGSNWPFAG